MGLLALELGHMTCCAGVACQCYDGEGVSSPGTGDQGSKTGAQVPCAFLQSLGASFRRESPTEKWRRRGYKVGSL